METQNRQEQITRTAILGILVNVIIAVSKIVIGAIGHSLAIMSEGINNATDAGSSFLTLVGTKLSAKHPDEKHPFGYGRIEYLTGLIVGALILYAGIGILRESVDAILHPEEMHITILAIVIVAVTAVVKFMLGNYTIRIGKETGSDALTAVGEEGKGDSLISIMTIATSIIFLITGKSLDAYAGIVFSFLIMKAGYEALKNTTEELIGNAGKEELAKEIYKEIRKTEGIINVADMMLHNYGPDRYSGSVNVEIDHKKSIGDVYEYLHELQLRIMHEYHVTMVFGIYAVDYDSPYSQEMRRYIGYYVSAQEHVKSFHALYVSEETKTIYVDFIVDYKLEDWEMTKQNFIQYMKGKYPEYMVELTIETEYV